MKLHIHFEAMPQKYIVRQALIERVACILFSRLLRNDKVLLRREASSVGQVGSNPNIYP